MADQWYVGRDGTRSGPFSTEALRQMAAAGRLVPGDLLWREGLETWVPLSTVKGLLPPGGGGTLPPLDLSLPVGTAGRPAGDFDFQAGPSPGSRPSGPTDWNPYQASMAAPGATAAADMIYANFLPRVGAHVLDSVFMGAAGMAIQVGMAMVFGVLSGGQDAIVAIGALLGSLAGFLVALVYFVGYETSAKQGTWGKQIVGIKVTDVQGRPITTGRAVGRFFAKIITNMTCGIGYLLPLFTDRRQTLHDLICECLALKK